MKKSKKIFIIIITVIVLLIGGLIGAYIYFNNHYSKINSEKAVKENELVPLVTQINEIDAQLTSLDAEGDSIKNEISSLENEKIQAQNTISTNAWKILKIAEVAQEKYDEVSTSVDNVKANYQYGNISLDDYIKYLEQAKADYSTYIAIVNKATELGDKYKSYATGSSSVSVSNDNLAQQLNSLEKETNKLISRISQIEKTISSKNEELNQITSKNASQVSDLSSQKTEIQTKITALESEISGIERKLSKFPYNLLVKNNK